MNVWLIRRFIKSVRKHQVGLPYRPSLTCSNVLEYLYQVVIAAREPELFGAVVDALGFPPQYAYFPILCVLSPSMTDLSRVV